MKYIKLGVHLFSKNILMNIVLILQVSIVLLLLNIVIGYTVGTFSYINSFDDIAKNNGVYFTGEAIIPGTVDDVKVALNERFKNLKDASVLSADYYDLFGYDLFALTNDGLTNYNPKLKEGKWINDTSCEDGVIPAVISIPITGVEVGDVFEIKGTNKFRFQIIGILASPYIIDFRNGSNKASAEHIMLKTNWPVFLINQDAMNTDAKGLSLDNSIAFFNTTDQEIINQNITELKKYGFTTKLNDVKVNGIENTKNTLSKILPFLIFTISISLIGLIGCSILAVVKNTRFYSVLYMIGNTWQGCSRIILSYFSVIIFISILLSSSLYFLMLNGVINGFIVTFSSWNIIAIVMTILIIILITIIPIFMLSKISPVSLLRKSK